MTATETKKTDRQVDELIEKLYEIYGHLSLKQELNSPGISSEFRRVIKRTENNKDTLNKDRALRLAIAGLMKVGKSSFLNTVLFDGEDILPQAATPMTAALTHISYAETNSAEIVFYSESDWDAIKAEEDDYQSRVDLAYKTRVEQYHRQMQTGSGGGESIPMPTSDGVEKEIRNNCPAQITACHDQWIKSDASVRLDTARRKSEMLEGNDLKDLMGRLGNYVGAGGEYTPYVKYVQLRVCDDRLKDLEITDTPGILDPILSRGQKTAEFVKNSDAILFLTSSDKPLSDSEISFIKKTINEEKFEDTYIIGTKLDSLMRQRSVRKTGHFDEDKKAAWRSIRENSVRSLRNCGVTIPDGQIIAVSSWLYEVGRSLNKTGKVPERMAATINALKKSFPDFPAGNAEEIIKISNIRLVLDKVLPYYREKKDEILLSSAENYVRNRVSEAIQALGAVQTDSENMLRDLKEFDRDDLQKRYEGLKRALNGMRGETAQCFADSAMKTERDVSLLIAEIRGARSEYTNVDVEINSKTDRIRIKDGLFKKHDELVKSHYKVGQIGSAYTLIGEYSAYCDKSANARYGECLDTRKLKAEIQSILDKNLKSCSVSDVNSSDLLLHITEQLGGIGAISASTDPSIYYDMLSKRFPNATRDIRAENEDAIKKKTDEKNVKQAEALQHLYSNIESGIDPDILKSELVKILGQVDKDIAEILSECMNRDCARLKELSGSFINKFENSIKANLDHIIEMMKNKDEYIAKLSAHINMLKQQIEDLENGFKKTDKLADED